MTTRTGGLKNTQFGALWDFLCSQPRLWISVTFFTVLLLLLNLRALSGLFQRWQEDPNYGHGVLIPFIALYFIYVNRSSLAGLHPKVSYTGLFLLLAAMIMKYVAMPMASVTFEGIAMVVMVNALILYLAGWGVYRVLAIPALYLFFMLPLPAFVHTMFAFPLQLFASKVSAAVLQNLFGVSVILSGNVLNLVDHQLSVEEACSGMRSILGLLALGVAFAYLIKRPFWERAILIVSTIPIAIVANVLRVTLTAMLFDWGYSNLAEGVYHTMTGWFVFLFALAMFLGLNWLLGKLFVELPPRPGSTSKEAA